MELILATRKSALAQTQTQRVMKLLKEKSGVDSKKFLVVTEGDKRLDVSLNKIGGKGLFTKEIEIALLENKAHAAIHSMKDVPYEMGKHFELIAMPEREDVRDVLVCRNGLRLEELKKGAIIGTSSIRRAAQIKNIRNDLYIIGTYEVNGVIVKKDILGNKEDNIELGKKLAQKILMGQ